MTEPPAPNDTGAGAETKVSTEETHVAPRSAGESVRYGDFLVVSKLGAGAMGIVYTARQLINERPTRTVAIKILKPELSNDASFEERFFREAEHALNLHHPNIVQGIHAKKENGVCFMAMEFIDGESLASLVVRNGPLSVGDALYITLEVARGLKHAHDSGVFHRDIKPGNVMVSRSGEVKVTDLGLAKAPASDLEITHHGQLVGTPVYMAPEQSILADNPDPRYDVYALGGTLFYLLTGQSPFSGSTVAEIQRQKRRPPSVRAVRNDAPSELDTLVRSMLESDPAERLQSMRDVIEAIRRTDLANRELSWIEGEDTDRAIPRRSLPVRRRWPALAIGGVMIVTASAVGYWLWSRGEESTAPTPPSVAPHAPSVAPKAAQPQQPSTRPDVFVARAMTLAAEGKRQEARAALTDGLQSHPQDERLRQLQAEVETGVLPLLQYKETSGAVNPPIHLPAADGIILPSGTQFRIGIALARECYVYIFSRDSVPKVARLFPNAGFSALQNPLPSGFHWIPGRDEQEGVDQWMRVDKAKGEDNIYIVAATRPLRDEGKVISDIRNDPEQLRLALARDPGSVLASGEGSGVCFATSEWSSFSFQHK